MVYLLLLAVCIVIAAGFAMGHAIGRRRGAAHGALILAWILAMAHLYFVRQPLAEAPLLEAPGYVFLRGVLYLPFAAAFLGALGRRVRERSQRTLRLLLILLCLVAVYDFRWAIHGIGYGDLVGRRNDRGVYLASTPDTRAAAAAATLVAYYGFAPTEGAMARATLSRPNGGTDAVGVLHGVRRMLRGTECTARIERLDWAGLRAQRGPALLFTYESRLRTPAVVALVASGEGVLVADPRRGVLYVDRKTMKGVWSGLAVVVDAPPYLRITPGAPLWVGAPNRPFPFRPPLRARGEQPPGLRGRTGVGPATPPDPKSRKIGQDRWSRPETERGTG